MSFRDSRHKLLLTISTFYSSLTHWGQKKMASISETICWNVSLGTKVAVFWKILYLINSVNGFVRDLAGYGIWPLNRRWSRSSYQALLMTWNSVRPVPSSPSPTARLCPSGKRIREYLFKFIFWWNKWVTDFIGFSENLTFIHKLISFSGDWYDFFQVILVMATLSHNTYLLAHSGLNQLDTGLQFFEYEL